MTYQRQLCNACVLISFVITIQKLFSPVCIWHDSIAKSNNDRSQLSINLFQMC